MQSDGQHDMRYPVPEISRLRSFAAISWPWHLTFDFCRLSLLREINIFCTSDNFVLASQVHLLGLRYVDLMTLTFDLQPRTLTIAYRHCVLHMCTKLKFVRPTIRKFGIFSSVNIKRACNLDFWPFNCLNSPLFKCLNSRYVVLCRYMYIISMKF